MKTRTWAELQNQAATLGFAPDALERVLELVGLLNGLRSHPYLTSRIALKGGTALNLFVLDLPRLSVDIDLNYVGSIDRGKMLAERPRVEQAIEAVCGRLDLTVKHLPTQEHAGGKWRLGYQRSAGGTGTLELDLNFVHRAPLWPVSPRDSHGLAGDRVTAFPVLDLHDLVGGKLAALFARSASRDVFDAHALLQLRELDLVRLRVAFVAYGGMSRRDWREVAVTDVRLDDTEADRMLVPLLRAGTAPARGARSDWTHNLVTRTRELLGAVLPLTARETTFLDRLNDAGEIVPELLTDDVRLQAVVRTHPGLTWKAQNVRKPSP